MNVADVTLVLFVFVSVSLKSVKGMGLGGHFSWVSAHSGDYNYPRLAWVWHLFLCDYFLFDLSKSAELFILSVSALVKVIIWLLKSSSNTMSYYLSILQVFDFGYLKTFVSKKIGLLYFWNSTNKNPLSYWLLVILDLKLFPVTNSVIIVQISCVFDNISSF